MLQTGSATAARTARPTEPATVASAATPNYNGTVEIAPTSTQLEDVEGSCQESANPTLDVTDVPVAPVAVTTTSELVEQLAADTTSFWLKFSTTTEEFLPALEPGQNVELAIVEPRTEAEISNQKLVEPEPSFCHLFVEPQN